MFVNEGFENEETDEEFLQRIYHELEEANLDTSILLQNRDFLDAAVNQAILSGLYTEAEADKAMDLIIENLIPSAAFRGQFIQQHQWVALKMLRETGNTKPVDDVPVGLLPAWHLNACAIESPSGGAVLIMNSGVILVLALLLRSYFAYITWHDDEPFCRDHSQSAFGLSIVLLAQYCVTGNVKVLASIPALDCPSLNPFTDDIDTLFAATIENIIMLHEYGHIILNHFSNEAVSKKNISPDFEVGIFNLSQQKEFEADAFAYQTILAHSERNGGIWLPTDIAHSFGILLHFYALCDAIKNQMEPTTSKEEPTHPPPLERWKHIKQLSHFERDAKETMMAHRVDVAFRVLYKGSDLEPSF